MTVMSTYSVLATVLVLMATGWSVPNALVTAASFYGSSYVSVAFQEAKSTTDLSFRFKTHLSEALLVLAAGSTDYCLLVLESGGIKVRINLGAGEAELTSPPGLRLNDLLWHDVSLRRNDAEMQLVVDAIHPTRLSIPGHFYELNIHFGIHVGGLGDFSELFLGNMDSFRGCLDNLTFNSINIFKQAQEGPDYRGIHAVTWDCSDEFDAMSDRAYSFVSNGAFFALPSINARNGGTISMDLKTQGNTSIILYNGGLPSKSDFVALELLNGKPKLSVDKGNGVIELRSEVTVNDGLWHHIEAQFTPTYVEINVDQQLTNLRPSLGGNRHFDLSGKLYAGGIELSKQARALAHGLESMIRSDTHDGSFKGCMHNMRINGQLLGLRDAQITQGLRVDCVWEYPCLKDPCIEEAVCLQQGIDGFRCLCDQPICMKTDIVTGYKVYPKSHQGDFELLQLQPLHVKEGSSELLTTNNIDVVLDLHKYGIRESSVLFHMMHSPKHGKLEVEIWRRPDENIFTLLDLTTDKVRYFHDGSENHQDSIMMEVEFKVRKEDAPEFLIQRHRFIQSIVITPVNDPPELKLPAGKVLRLAQNTKKLLSQEILNAVDEDNRPEDLVYSVLTLGSENSGYVESSRNLGVPLETFTQSDVDQGLISYVHRGAPNTRIGFRVSDGIETGQTSVLRIAAFDLQLFMINNTGIVVTYNSYNFINPENLTFTTNANDQELELRYDVVQLPQYGNIQRLRNKGHWQTVNHFTQWQIVNEKLRYAHTSGRPAFDEFKFTVTANEMVTSSTYHFRITFQAISLKIVNNEELLLDQKQERNIQAEILKVKTIPVATPDTELVFNVIALPHYGDLYIHTRDNLKHKLQKFNNFTQSDVNLGQVGYVMKRKPYSVIRDSFEFQVHSPHEVSLPVQFNVRCLPGETDATINVERLEVEEGEQQLITTNLLHVETPTIKEFVFNLTQFPQHGELRLLSSSGIAEKTAFFTSADIADQRLLYQHDDSEHNQDNFTFLILPVHDDYSFQYIGTQYVHVLMKNDNPPRRAIDTVFEVVAESERYVTGQDLRYDDPDINTQPSDIQYTRRGIPNGALFHADSPTSQVFQFSQKDLDERKIIFKHSGSLYGRTVLWVTDGQFYTTGIFEIRASDPFITIVNNTRILVKRGKRARIITSNLNFKTNINAGSEDINYIISSKPSQGKILVNEEETTQFTQSDVEMNRVEYENFDSNAFRDYFTLSVHLGNAKATADIQVRIYPESYWEPLVIVNNRILVLDEGQNVVIGQPLLQITHPNVDPHDVIFIVQDPPKHGRLEIHNTYGGFNRSSELNYGYRQVISENLFDQSTINEGRLNYIQTHMNVSDDQFVFDVSNGVVEIRNLSFTIHIISKVIHLETQNLSVQEGGKVLIRPNDIIVLSRYAKDAISGYDVTTPPMHGHIQNAQNPGTIISHFTSAMLQEDLVQYVHDGSETLFDSFFIVTKIPDKGRESHPTRFRIYVAPINDEFPKVVNNTGLEVWDGSTTMITKSHLAATDEDSGPAELTFIVSNVHGGFVALQNSSTHQIDNFTQEDINRHQLYFVHTGTKRSLSGGFYFQVTDGQNIGSRQNFIITAKAITLQLAVNEKLYVFPKVRQTITMDNLMAVTSDRDSTREIVFRVKKKPTLGKIIVDDENGVSAELDQFSQRDVNMSKVAYEHTKPFSELSASDTFSFNVDCPFASSLQKQIFNIEISLLKINSEGLDKYISLSPLTVKEGEHVSIDQHNFNTSGLNEVLSEIDYANFVPQLYMVMQELPTHGVILKGDENVTIGTKLTQADIDSSNLEYHHDHSDTLWDNTVISIYLDSTEIGGTSVILLNCSLNITILPVNDQPFELVTKSPSIEVVQGQMTLITSENLQTVDLDTSPDGIFYDIITGPTFGRIVLSPDFQKPVQAFTQEDIDKGVLFYVHEGPHDAASFHFKVSDGAFKPTYNVFNIYIVPLYLKMTNHSVINIPQGTSAIYLKPEHLGAETNGNRSNIWYNVTVPPKYGIFLMHDEIVTQFQQLDIDSEQVLYMQINMDFSEDSFTVDLENEDLCLENQKFRVLVSPLIKQRDYHVPFGTKAVITLQFLNASQLALHSRSNPLFTITQKPKYGTLRHMHRKTKPRRSLSTSDVEQFTHTNILNNEIFYETFEQSQDYSNDSFEYRLTASFVQPTEGRFDFILHPYGAIVPDLVTVNDILAKEAVLHVQVRSTSPGLTSHFPSLPTSSVDVSNNTSVYSPHISNDHLLIIGIAIGVVFLSIVIITVVKCSNNKRKNQQEKKKNKKKNKSSSTKNGRPASAHGGRQECDQRPDILEQQSHASDYLNDEVPSISSRSGPTSPKLRPAIGGLRHEVAPLRTTPSPNHEEDWMEISSIVPTCKVTSLNPSDSLDVNETTMKYPYGMLEPPEIDDWSVYDQSDMRFPRPLNPLLRKNQYWV